MSNPESFDFLFEDALENPSTTFLVWEEERALARQKTHATIVCKATVADCISMCREVKGDDETDHDLLCFFGAYWNAELKVT